jgi:heme/copper-type cytochrome/quinol oxidase subunit 2
MRLFALPVTLIVVAILVYLLVALVRGARSAPRTVESKPHWEVDTVMQDGWTLIVVRRVVRGRGGPVELTKQTVRAIPDDDPNWDERYREGMAEARSRVSTLELESG